MSWRHLLLVIIFAPALLAAPVSSAYASDVALQPFNDFKPKLTSFHDQHLSRVVMQSYDFSCGSAAVATLLTYSYNRPTTEEAAFRKMYDVGDQAHIREVGFSLLDMQKYLASIGLHADGYKLSVERLKKLNIPAIVLISPGGYNHFVVVRGWQNDTLLVADPALGLRRIETDDFKGMWNGIVFVLHDNVGTAKRHYNDPDDLKILVSAPVSAGMAYPHWGLTDFFLNLPEFNDF